TVTGAASAGLEVEVFDGSASKGKAMANTNGQWTFAITGLAVAAHSIKAKALYGGGAESAVRGFTVAAVVAPTVSSIKAASGAEIPAGGITVETSVTVTGAASAGLEVEVFDGSASKGKAMANTNGQWTFAITGLADGAHAIKAKALYGNGDESAVRSFSVFDAFPTIISIRDSNGVEIPENTLTYDPILTISGVSFVNQTGVLIALVNGVQQQLATVTVGASGAWSVTRTLSTKGQYFVKLTSGGSHSALRQFRFFI
ncbi:hypothetical protein ABQX22_00120, partial [Xanthomonas sp. WHRI 1810A]|uniref:hypothetical protein n=1 Tax=Xanthomonas sp. WHRI 1810A TaxID=3161565 RepID=UPI0032E85D33